MLGLGNTIISGSGLGYKLVNTYTSDFTGGSGSGGTGNITSADGAVWEDYSIDGNLTKTLNATVDGSTGWLKCTFDTEQTNAGFGILCDDLDSFTTKVGDYSIISFKTYLDGDWEGADSIQTRVTISGNGGAAFGENGPALTPSASIYPASSLITLEQDEVTNVSGTYSTTTEATNSIRLLLDAGVFIFAANDAALAGASFAIKDVVIKTYRKIGQ